MSKPSKPRHMPMAADPPVLLAPDIWRVVGQSVLADTVLVRDIQDRITFWNRGAHELYGWSTEEALGQTTHKLLRTEFPASRSEIEAELHRTGRWEGELAQSRRNDSRIVVTSRWSLQRDAAGRPVATLETNNDITARKDGEGALSLLSSEFAQRSIRAQASFVPEPPLVVGDAIQLQQLLLNLLINASEASTDLSAERCCITVSTDTQLEDSRVFVVVAVRDAGVGIPEADHLPRLFEPFYTTQTGGLGTFRARFPRG